MTTIIPTAAEDALIALDRAAWVADEAQGRIAGVGMVLIIRDGNRRRYWLDGAKTTARAVYQAARSAAEAA